MSRRNRIQPTIGRTTPLNSGDVFELSANGKKQYLILGKTDLGNKVEYCSIEEFPFCLAEKRYQDGVEHLEVMKSPFQFSVQHINWLRNYLNEKNARKLGTLGSLENGLDYIGKVLSYCERDGLGPEVTRLRRIIN